MVKTKRLLAALTAALLLVLGTAVAPAAAADPGFRVDGQYLLDGNGNRFEMRGINHPHAFFPGQTRAFADIRATGANTVRVVLSNGSVFTRTPIEQVADVVNRCKANKLICVLEVHDTTGYGDRDAAPAGAASLASAVDYWKSVASAVKGQERWVVLNIGNEPFGNTGDGRVAEWAPATTSAIASLRADGFSHTIMVDAPNWGQDWSGTMRTDARGVFDADPARNTIFSVHMYEVYGDAGTVNAYLDAFVGAGLTLVVGEFGPEHYGQNVDEAAIMAAAESRGIGYLAWSWSENGPGTEALDVVRDFEPGQFTSWGQRLVEGTNGIRATSTAASVY